MKEKSTYKGYVISAYITFYLMVLVICGGAAMLFKAPPVVMRVLSNVCAWSPTLVLLIGFAKFCPGTSRAQFLRNVFSGRIRVGLLVLPPVIIATGSLAAAFVFASVRGVQFTSLFSMNGYTFLASFLFSLLSGPTGEELGWRGFLRQELAKKYPFVKAAVVQGVIWAFWHAVLWFVDSEFLDWRIIPYIASNVIVMVCLVIVMNAVLEKELNLLYPVLIHFAFNFVYCFLRIDILFYIILSAVYVLIAAGFLLWRNRTDAQGGK